MKKTILLIAAIAANQILFGQSVGVNTTTPHASAALDVTSTTQGVLVPRMTQAQRNLIGTPASGLLVYQTDNTPGFYFYNGSAWTSLSSPSYSAGTGISISGGTISNTGDLSNTNELELPSQAGNSGKYLSTNGSTPAWVTAPGGGSSATLDAQLSMSGTQTLAAATIGPPVVTPNAIVQLNTQTVSGGIGSFNAGTYTYTVGVTGLYMISGNFWNTQNAPVNINLVVNGTDREFFSGGNSLYSSQVTANLGRTGFSTAIPLTAGDNISFRVFSASSGTGITLAAGSFVRIVKL